MTHLWLEWQPSSHLGLELLLENSQQFVRAEKGEDDNAELEFVDNVQDYNNSGDL